MAGTGASDGKPPRDLPDWNHARDSWLNDSTMARENDFNKFAEVSGWYPFYEIQLANGNILIYLANTLYQEKRQI
ncbi:hypothetical protein [Marivirga sericea]|nr:hypothetical protein [Marivirga sericea]